MIRQAHLVLLLILLLSTQRELRAQDPTRTTVSLTAGYSRNDFRYLNLENSVLYDYRSSFPVITLSSESFLLSAGYGTQEADPSRGLPSLTMIEATASLGSNVQFFRKLFGFPLGLFVPIRSTFDYRQLSTGEDDLLELSDLNLVSTAIGVGIGGRFRPIGTARNNVTILAIIVSSVGILADAAHIEKNSRVSRTIDFNFDVKFEGLLDDKIGLTLGFTFRSHRWTNHSPESFGDFADAIKRPTDIPKRRGQSLFRAGINW